MCACVRACVCAVCVCVCANLSVFWVQNESVAVK